MTTPYLLYQYYPEMTEQVETHDPSLCMFFGIWTFNFLYLTFLYLHYTLLKNANKTGNYEQNEYTLRDRMCDNTCLYESPLYPLIVKLDAQNFRALAKKFEQPFDSIVTDIFEKTAIDLHKRYSPNLVYTKSDEFYLVFSSRMNYYNNDPLNISSIMASYTTSRFVHHFLTLLSNKKFGNKYKDILENVSKNGLDVSFNCELIEFDSDNKNCTDYLNYIILCNRDANNTFYSKLYYNTLKNDKNVSLSDKIQYVTNNKLLPVDQLYSVKYQYGTVVHKVYTNHSNDKHKSEYTRGAYSLVSEKLTYDKLVTYMN